MKYIAVILLLLCSIDLKAQEKEYPNEYGFWAIYVGSYNFNSKWSVFYEGQFRDYKMFGDMEAIVFRIAPQYNLNKNITLSIGYSYFFTKNEDEGEKVEQYHEHRPYEQVFIKTKYGRVYLNHRYRFEQRFREDRFDLRFRYFLQTNIALNNSELTDNTFYISSYAEIFLNTEEPVYDRTRFYVGLGYAITSNLKVEVGSLTQFYGSRNKSQLNVFLFQNLHKKSKKKE